MGASVVVLERPHVRLKLIRELAAGEATQVELAQRYGVTQPAIANFKKRHAERIASVRDRLDDEFAGIVFAGKANRIEMLSQQIEDVTSILADPETAARAGVQYAEMARTAQTAARAISEELGQLPARTLKHEGGVSVRYEVVGVDPEVLR